MTGPRSELMELADRLEAFCKVLESDPDVREALRPCAYLRDVGNRAPDWEWDECLVPASKGDPGAFPVYRAALSRPVGDVQKKLTAEGQHQPEQSGKQLSQAWQPIETAPTDGRYIIAGYFRGNELRWVKHTRWMTAEQAAENDGGDPADYDCGWTDGEDEDDYSATPTHWMPLVPPPLPETDAVAPGDAGGGV